MLEKHGGAARVLGHSACRGYPRLEPPRLKRAWRAVQKGHGIARCYGFERRMLSWSEEEQSRDGTEEWSYTLQPICVVYTKISNMVHFARVNRHEAEAARVQDGSCAQLHGAIRRPTHEYNFHSTPALLSLVGRFIDGSPKRVGSVSRVSDTDVGKLSLGQVHALVPSCSAE